MRFTQGALGMLAQRYKGILKKCHLLNTLGAVVVSAFLMGGASMAFAAAPIIISDSHQVADSITEEYTTIDVNSGGSVSIARNGKVVGTDVTVNSGGTLTSGKNLHFGNFSGAEPNTGLLANTLTIDGGVVTGTHLGFGNGGVVAVNGGGRLTLDTMNDNTNSAWGGNGKLTINGGILDIANLSIAHDKLVEADTANSLILTNNGQLIVRDALAITDGSFTNTLGGAIKAGKLVMDGQSYTHNTSNSLNIIGMAGGGAFFTGTNLTVSQGDVFLGSDATPSGTHTTTADVSVDGGLLQVGHGNWQAGDLTQTGGQVKVSGNGVLAVGKLDQSDGLLTVGGTSNTGKLTVDGSFANTTYNAGTAGVAVTGTGVLGVKYSELVNAAGDDFLYTATQKAINVAEGGTLLLNGYSGSDMTVAEFKTLSDKLLSTGSTGTVQGINVDTSGASLQDVASAHLAVPDAVVDGSAGITSGAATVGGVTGATVISGGASLTLTGQGAAAEVLATDGVTLDASTLTLGSNAGSAGSGTLYGDIDASSSTGTSTINVVNGNYTVAGEIKGAHTTNSTNINVTNSGRLTAQSLELGSNDTINVGNASNSGTLIATDISMNGGRIDFDPPFAAAGDTSNASMGGLAFTSNAVDALMTVGQNSMVSLGSTDAEWLRTEVQRFQSDGKGLWGQDITAALALRTPQTLDAAGGINVDGTWVTGGSAATANTAHFADKSLLVVDAAGVGSGVALSGEAGGTSTLIVDSGAKLHIVGGQDGETLNVTGGFGASTKDAASWTGSNLTTSTALLSATGGTFDTANGAYSVSLKANAVASSFPMLSSSMGALVDRMVIQTGVNPNSPNAGVRFISRAMSDNYIGTTDRNKAAATVEGAAQMAAVGAVQGSTLSAATAASGAVLNRTSMALPRTDMSQAVAVRQDTDGSLSLDSGLSAGDGLKNGLGIWIMPLYQSNSVWGMKAENFKTGYNSNLGGIAMGADYTINDMFRFGAAFNVGAGYAKSNGDFNSTDNRFNFWGVSLYGGWVYNNFGLSADVGYTGNYSKVEQDMPASMQMSDLKADVTSHAWNTGLKAEYKFNAGALDIIPHVGVRYLRLVTDGYDVKSGGTVFEVDESMQSIWTFPVGVSFAKAFETESGWQIKPQLDLGVIPAAGDVKARSKARIPGVDSQAEMKMQVLDYATFDGGLGFELGKGDFTLGLNYNLQASEHRTGHGVFGSLRYEF
ncbi:MULTISPECIES: autotransporter domain-containing protein [Desulfovibrio]|uniref:Uncharacterized conserved protein, contains a C-terminal beta-barrel porin domain n=1 Tax=Desulfovibrio desulfuricans TaxID=876 RepID=A0AA94HQM3_DESDE|nr:MULTISPECIES: autotransporter domain-containing protein [Desulfovibrio]ATD80530.1 autotransporter domain-containing protein [Desulfovibrio sp. G11]SFW20711.1 Uncharacterized conserved protein, contains a C-terminal beta-barrel porin domain [Desulfovibrio desulfuricans]SPD36020.1 phage P22 tailspike protein like [Desulfovibrio sp. G11]